MDNMADASVVSYVIAILVLGVLAGVYCLTVWIRQRVKPDI